MRFDEISISISIKKKPCKMIWRGGGYLQKNVGQAAFDEVHLYVVYRWG